MDHNGYRRSITAIVPVSSRDDERSGCKAGDGEGTILITVPAGVYRARASEIIEFITSKAPAGRIDSVTDSEMVRP